MTGRYPWEHGSQQWDESDFDRIQDGRDLYRAREIIQEAIAAIQSGRIKHWFPSPGTPVNQQYVDDAIRTIDYEWEREVSRDRSRTGGPQFMQRLDPAQRACLIERLASVLGRGRGETT
ncbi:MAG: hypothetical protein HYY01_06760 [Chloroflexi bacterium]|nr:hypothetical protein [Chloroflexota bacterium]